MVYEPITHNTAEFSMHVAAVPSVYAPVHTISSAGSREVERDERDTHATQAEVF